MTATIDAAGRVVIPKALRERAGLTPGMRIDFHFRDGCVEITPAHADLRWEEHQGIRFPVLHAEGGPSGDAVRDLIEGARGNRSEQVFDSAR